MGLTKNQSNDVSFSFRWWYYHLFIFLLPLLALISALMNDFPGNEKILWVLIILFLPFLGSVLYFLIGRGKRTNR